MYNSLATIIGKKLEDSYGLSTDVTLTPPSDMSHGDLTTNVAMQVSKKVGKSPIDIAKELINELEASEDIESAEIAGPGFININLTIAARLKLLLRAQDVCSPQKERSKEAPIVVEYSSPNIAKPLGVHHILSTVIGQVIANLYRHLGYKVITVNHIGDWGTQFGKLAVADKKWGEKDMKDCGVEDLLALYVRFHDESEKDAGLEDEARAAFKSLEQGDKEMREFWKKVVDISMREIKETYKRLNVSIDHDHGESFYEDKMLSLLDEGRKSGVFKEGEKGALIAEFPEESNLPPAIVLKADGSTIYHTRDLAVIKYRMGEWHPKSSLYVVDISQKLHFEQLFAMAKQLKWDLPELEHVIFGHMSLPDAKMSTRKGNIIRLEDALDEAVNRADKLIAERETIVPEEDKEELSEMVGIGAFVYTILSQNRKSNIVFTWDKAMTFEGNSGPYVQYTHARAKSVLEKAEVDQIDPPSDIESLENHELMLMRHMAKFPAALEQARKDAMPHKLTQYLYELCQIYNSMYNALPIIKADEPQKTLRLALTKLTADILKTGADILTIRVPDRM
ncbi:arginine--tRNA ligase [Candidatus Peribacteria bacterium]|nr:arginine--tRNA ligase [Candidatus Peribacteria bacterium]MBT4021315.1 arginine--tRNA ligase [Candidatus Peribacteria bacterium]MBT4241224.1 arginine--tRNA ligase [Candidatus Peribacteria bacterium]MBT4474249.1 arginine--tRNA ligase [Candidatus Peribacteria bacterium]